MVSIKRISDQSKTLDCASLKLSSCLGVLFVSKQKIFIECTLVSGKHTMFIDKNMVHTGPHTAKTESKRNKEAKDN